MAKKLPMIQTHTAVVVMSQVQLKVWNLSFSMAVAKAAGTPPSP